MLFGFLTHSTVSAALLPSKPVAIQILAAGETNDENIELEIDGTVVALYENVGGNADAGQFVTYAYDDPQINSIETLRVNFINNGSSMGADRNVRIDAIIVNGQRYETEAPTVYSVGSWIQADGCAPGYKQREWLNCNGYFEFQIGIALNPIAGTFGESTITHIPTTVQFQSSVTNPVIIASVPTFNDSGPGMLAINNVNDTGFEIRFQEWSYLDQTHGDEKVEWLALEPGVYSTADGSIWEVGTVLAANNLQFASKNFQADFDAKPIVLTSLQTANGPPVIARVRNITVDGFEAGLFESEDQLGTPHPTETVGYLAILPSANSGIVTINNEVFPYLFEEFEISYSSFQAQRRSSPLVDDPLPQTTVAINTRLSLILVEEQSQDSETTHVPEQVAVVTLGSDVYAQDQTLRGGDPFTLRSIRMDTPITLPAGFQFTEVLGAAAFANAVSMEIDDNGRIFVGEESGIIWLIENGTKNPVPYLDISNKVANEFADNGGFSGFALAPDFATSGFLFVLYTTDDQGQEYGRVERYQQSTGDPNVADPNSSLILIGNDSSDGFRKGTFHNVGDLEFGADGSLLISWGDTASNEDDDPDQFLAQDFNSAAGKILRVDPATGLGYSSNPFYSGVASDVASKIWVLGLRNGFRFEHVPGTGTASEPGKLIITDVGRHDFESIDVVSGGENLGWPYFEGNQRFRLGGDNLILTFPAIVYSHPGSRSVIGGAFYEGTQWPIAFHDRYFISDFVTGWLKSYDVTTTGSVTEFSFGLEVKGMTDMKFDPTTGSLYLVGRGRDIIFDDGEGLDGLYSITYTGP